MLLFRAVSEREEGSKVIFLLVFDGTARVDQNFSSKEKREFVFLVQ